jgi:cysteine dioxygenase
MNTLAELFDAIDRELQAGKRLRDLGPVLSSYSGDDWKEYESYHPNHYSRNRVHMNERIELLVLCWEIGQGCPVHDHPENGCLVRVMQGEVTENIYRLEEKPVFLSSSVLPTNGIAYKESTQILHEIINHSGRRAASIHIYAPPDYKPRYFF